MKKIIITFFVLFLSFSICSFAEQSHKNYTISNEKTIFEELSEGLKNMQNELQGAVRLQKENKEEYERISKITDRNKRAEAFRKANEKLDVLAESTKASLDLSAVLNKILERTHAIAVNLVAFSLWVLKLLFSLEFITILIKKPTEFPIGNITVLLVKLFMLMYVIQNWQWFCESIFLPFAKEAGRKAAGITSNIPVSPGHAWEFLIKPFEYSWQSLGKTDFVEAAALLLFYILGIIVIFILVSHIFMALLEFEIIVKFSVILLPFLIWKNTESIGTRVFSSVSSQIARFMVLTFFFSLGLSIISIPPTLNVIGSKGGYSIFALYIAAIYIFGQIFGKIPAIASSLMSGGSGALSGHDATRAVSSAIGAGIAAAVLGVRTLAFGKSAVGATGGALGTIARFGRGFMQRAAGQKAPSGPSGGQGEAAISNSVKSLPSPVQYSPFE
ncbi:type IV secretion system protein [Fusobacterium necrophorum]|uniref:Conjugal transfer protein TrbL n=1 Tax=Fusobacterium necrophorum TaxID=859 RepID=A0A4Q2KSH4_9FUSO|nr:type IV secretion system protein [Fusobacterium necrophorum]RXZ68424.1 hypothetical protein EPT53_09875 [Fusobacterium necrophorum]